MDAWLHLPLVVRLSLVMLAGACAGAWTNWAVYSLCYHPRPLSPWSRGYPRRDWLDRIPLLGWLRAAPPGRLYADHPRWRPLAVEMATCALWGGLYLWEVEQAGLFASTPREAALIGAQFPLLLHAMFLVHVLLGTVLWAITLIDIDEQTIPDELTLPATLIGLVFMYGFPWLRWPDVTIWPGLQPQIEPLHVASPNSWPAALDAWPGLAAGLGCFLIWCVGLLPRPWRTRHGYRRALTILLARIARSRLSRLLAGVALVGSLGIIAAWNGGGEHWESLLSALVGLGVGGATVWVIRFIGSAALGREAMGFGDVTLLALVGLFVGWQPSLMIFFLAPLAGLVVGLGQLLLTRNQVIPFGPFLCLAALIVFLRWSVLWDSVAHLFAIEWLIPVAVAACVVGLAVVLALWGTVKRVWLGG